MLVSQTQPSLCNVRFKTPTISTTRTAFIRCVSSRCRTPNRVSEQPTTNCTLSIVSRPPVFTLKVCSLRTFTIRTGLYLASAEQFTIPMFYKRAAPIAEFASQMKSESGVIPFRLQQLADLEEWLAWFLGKPTSWLWLYSLRLTVTTLLTLDHNCAVFLTSIAKLWQRDRATLDSLRFRLSSRFILKMTTLLLKPPFGGL